MTTLVFDALVQPQREVGEHRLTHSARYGAQFRLNCILQLRDFSWLVDVHFSLRYPHKKNRKLTGPESRRATAHHLYGRGASQETTSVIRPSLPWKCGQ